MKLVIGILAMLAVLTAGSASARDRHPSHRHAGAHASAAHVPSRRAATSGFDGWPTDYLIERFGGRQAQGSF